MGKRSIITTQKWQQLSYKVVEEDVSKNFDYVLV